MSATVAVTGKPSSEASPSVDGRTKRGPKRVRKTGRTAAKVESRGRSSEGKAAVGRTSDILKKLISDESQQALTVDQIVQALGPTSFGTSLMVFSIPEVLPIPIPGMTAAVVIPTGIISSHLITCNRKIPFPTPFLNR